MNNIDLINKYNKPENSVLNCERKRFLEYRKNNPIYEINSLWSDYQDSFSSADFEDIESYLESLKPDYKKYTDFISKITEPKAIYNILPWFKYGELIEVLKYSPLCDYKKEDWKLAPLVLQVLLYSVSNGFGYPDKFGEMIGKIIVDRNDFFRLSTNYIVYIFNELQFVSNKELSSKIQIYLDDFIEGLSPKYTYLLSSLKDELEKNTENYNRLFNLLKCFILLCNYKERMDDKIFLILDDFILNSKDILHTSVFTEPLPNDLHIIFANYYMKSDKPIIRWEKSLNELFKQLHNMRFSSITETADLFNKINFVLSVGLAMIEVSFVKGELATNYFEIICKKVAFFSQLFPNKLECDFYKKYLGLLIAKFYFIKKKNNDSFDFSEPIVFVKNLGITYEIAFDCIFMLNLNKIIDIERLNEENKYYLSFLADYALKTMKPTNANSAKINFANELLKL